MAVTFEMPGNRKIVEINVAITYMHAAACLAVTCKCKL